MQSEKLWAHDKNELKAVARHFFALPEGGAKPEQFSAVKTGAGARRSMLRLTQPVE
ncbi:hypothetical protein LZV20_004564 [Salmonella enterica]|nr:hypothetical protein [Salmonella enterica]